MNQIHNSASPDLNSNIPPADPCKESDHGQKKVYLAHDTTTWRGLFSYFFKALIWAGLIFLLAKEFAVNDFWIVVLSVFLLSIPIGVSGIYGSTIRQIRRLTIFAEKGWFYRLFFGRSLKIVLWTCWALGTSFFMLVQFHTYAKLEWFVFFLIIPVFWIVFSLFRRLFVHEFKAYIITHMALTGARLLSPIIMLVIYYVLMRYFGNIPEYASFQQAIYAQKAAVADMTGSALVWEVSQYLAIYDGTKAYVLGRLGGQDTLWALISIGLGGYVIFYNACAMLSCFLIPGVEYRRLFNPLSDDKPQAIALSRIATIVAVFTFISLFIYLPLFAYIEFWVKQTTKITHARQSTESQFIQKLEQIDNVFFKQGTLEQLQAAKIDSLHKVDISLAQLDGQIDRAFDRMETNVDGFLDWYYSLVGEYARIASMMTGALEDYTAKKLTDYLQQGDAFKEVQAALNHALETHDIAQHDYLHDAQKIMAQNRIDPAGSPVQVVQSIPLKDILNPPIHQDIISLQHKLGGAAISGILTAVVVKKIIAKLVAKNVLKLAAKALTKVVISKTAGTAGGAGTGALAGAAIGSAVPVLGTATGAVIGAIIGGIVIGVSVDKMLIELEEAINREEFKSEILSAVQQARVEFKAQLNNESNTF
jgi:hypothetical protein